MGDPSSAGSGWRIPAAILLAGALIGAGLYLGLRHRASPPAPASSAVVPVVPPRRPVPLAPPAAAAELQARVTEQVRGALEQQRSTFVERCWSPSAQKSPEPASARYSFNITVDARGVEIARGISEDRAAFRADVGQCLRGLGDKIAVSPPGATVQVTVPLTLP
jgi:hypothetical protein